MITAVIVVIFVILVMLIVFYLCRGNKPRTQRLRRKFIALSHMSPADAEESLELQIENLRHKFPNRSMEWCLEKIIYDLERDRNS